MQNKSIAVFCGSRPGRNPQFLSDTARLGKLIAANNCRLIYGGGNNGLMAEVANSVLAAGGQVTGIMPQLLIDRENQHTGITELLVVEDMHQRKRMLFERCDIAIILPGGFGTLDELFEMLTWNQLSIHRLNVIILNSSGFYDALIRHLEKMAEEGFLYQPLEANIRVVNTPEEIFVSGATP
jgi:uncharacterized protein (TIGR00730 family)